ncbi:MAG: hypothetical protein ACJA0Z_000424 [Halioglobus sp.]|jgi:hypothetical protein
MPRVITKAILTSSFHGADVPYSGEWKRAAIIFYFRDIFVDPN